MTNHSKIFVKQNVIASLVLVFCTLFVWGITPKIIASPRGIVTIKYPQLTTVPVKNVSIYTLDEFDEMPSTSKYLGVLNAQFYGQGKIKHKILNDYIKGLTASVGANGLLILVNQQQADGVQTILARVYQL